MSIFSQLQIELDTLIDTNKASLSSRFFKTNKGEYGEGDIFRGINMPKIRQLAKKYSSLNQSDLSKLITSKYHEDRMLALIIKILQIDYSSDDNIFENYKFYMDNIAQNYINNWDLVDVSCTSLIGPYLFFHQDDRIEMAKSNNLWSRRSAIVSTFYDLSHQHSQSTYHISELLLFDNHDLIQKAVGWLLREMGKKIDESLLIKFLDQYASVMPRTSLRYSIERLDKPTRDYYMNLKYQKS